VQISDVGLTATVASDERKFELWFRRQSPGVTVTLEAASLAVKRAWLAEISCLLWTQAIHNRERRRSEQYSATCTGRHNAMLPAGQGIMLPDALIHDRFVAFSADGTKRSHNKRL